MTRIGGWIDADEREPRMPVVPQRRLTAQDETEHFSKRSPRGCVTLCKITSYDLALAFIQQLREMRNGSHRTPCGDESRTRNTPSVESLKPRAQSLGVDADLREMVLQVSHVVARDEFESDVAVRCVPHVTER